MNTFQCEACAEEYSNGGLVCPHHQDLIDKDLREKGQPVSLTHQYDDRRERS